jgi:hypothetical protein
MVVKVTAGAYFGHPNVICGECLQINPSTNQDLHSPAQDLPPSYIAPLVTVTWSVDGIMEYTAQHFVCDLTRRRSQMHARLKFAGLIPVAASCRCWTRMDLPVCRTGHMGRDRTTKARWQSASVAAGVYSTGKPCGPRADSVSKRRCKRLAGEDHGSQRWRLANGDLQRLGLYCVRKACVYDPRRYTRVHDDSPLRWRQSR